ncbi:putative transmembrane protein [Sesbania bispinosa]|nr:putative transmembrane protein [Sesbania bispinosa]
MACSIVFIERIYLSCHATATEMLKWSLTVDSQKKLLRKESLRQEQLVPNCYGQLIVNESGFLSLGNRVNTTRNKYSQYSNNSHVSLDIDSMVPLLGDKMTSQLQNNSTDFNLNKHKETKPRVPLFDVFNQQKRKEIAQHVSSAVLFTIMFLGLLFDIWSQSSLMKKVQPLHTERVPVSIWPSLLGLFGFMAFVWAVAIMILVGAPFTRMHRAMLILWAIFMLLKSANSITASYVPMLVIFFMGWFARGKATTK